MLVVDTDFHVLEVLTVYLQSRGHQVLCAVDGKQAREALDAGGVEVLITDPHLPRLAGFGLSQEVASSLHPPAVVMISESWTEEERQYALELGVACLHDKPLNYEVLALDVEELAG